ncbi:exo-alpha-sialidase [Larkinella bovis]|uniref:exo-alpha-sialidase n=1 Tax=Larkinella bovis TaxID=683041 RepID=A0ABW0IA08_9BACT
MKKWYLIARLCLIGCTGWSAAASAASPKNEKPLVWVHSPDVPLLKRQNQNPLLCLRVYISEGAARPALVSIQTRLNTAAVQQIDHLVLYQKLSEPHPDTTEIRTTFQPKAGEVSLPVDFSLKQGWNYIWLGAVLKPNADLDSRPSVELLGFTDRQNVVYTPSKKTGIPEKRIGIRVRKPGDDGVHTYRIPGIVRTAKGTLIAVYDNRYHSSKDLPGNIDIGMSRSTDGGKTWEPMKVIMDMGAPHENNGVGDPTVLVDPATGKIWVAAVWSKGNRAIAGSEPGLSPDVSGQFVLASSDDDGITWSPIQNITAQVKNPKWHIYFNGPGSGIAMKDGTLVFPSQYWDENTKPGIPHSAIIYSKDHGKTWHSGTGARRNTTESQVVETTPGTLMLNMRDNRGFYRAVATTRDLGKTWQEHPTSYHALQDPICMASLIKARVRVKGQQQDVLFFSNVNTSSIEDARKNTTIKASLDLGETWLPANEVLLDERYGYGYSSLVQLDEQTIGILYEGNRELIFLRIPVKDIIK